MKRNLYIVFGSVYCDKVLSSSRTLKRVKFDPHLMQYARLLIHPELLRPFALNLVTWNCGNFDARVINDDVI